MTAYLRTDTFDEFLAEFEKIKNTAVDSITLDDHLFGFDTDYKNDILDIISDWIKNTHKKTVTVFTPYIFDDRVRQNYQHCNFSLDFWPCFDDFKNYKIHPDRTHQKFLCSFNGSPHVSRQFLVSILHRFNWFDQDYVSKNFTYSLDKLDGNILNHAPERSRFYRKFFIGENSEGFFNTVNSFGFVQYNHKENIYTLEKKLTDCFVHLVSESVATSYYPFFSEKFLYSVVTRGLFVSYAQPGWHDHIQKYLGFRKYDKIFDYSFDAILNPLARLINLISMLSKFAILQPHDWHDLYMLEQDTIEFNYQHYHSGDYLRSMEKYA